jgi:hypothetical protein
VLLPNTGERPFNIMDQFKKDETSVMLATPNSVSGFSSHQRLDGIVNILKVDWVSEQNISAIPESLARFRGKFIIHNYNHNAVLEIMSPSIMKLLMDCPAT